MVSASWLGPNWYSGPDPPLNKGLPVLTQWCPLQRAQVQYSEICPLPPFSVRPETSRLKSLGLYLTNWNGNSSLHLQVRVWTSIRMALWHLLTQEASIIMRTSHMPSAHEFKSFLSSPQSSYPQGGGIHFWSAGLVLVIKLLSLNSKPNLPYSALWYKDWYWAKHITVFPAASC